ncbi:MAG: DUF362 domain-containing protein [Armatimonadetes bacterium]|nr:DUF362 domain-containing protein [Armatimonadota bacterium]
MSENKRRLALVKVNGDLGAKIRMSLEQTGLLDKITSTTRISIKPNFTYPYYKPGVTTSPEVIRETVKILREITPHIAIVETDGGYHAWKAIEAFKGHGIFDMADEFGIEAVNLCEEPRENITFRSGFSTHQLPLPTRLLHETDLFITMPVPKIHAMTGLTLAYKNQWGCVPDIMRLRRHYVFHDAIVAINRALKPVVVSDGTYFLDKNGPMEGEPVRMDTIIAATDAGTFDRYVSELMGWSWRDVKHMRRAVQLGDMPADLNEIEYNIAPSDAREHVFTIKRTVRHLIALSGFNSRFITWLGYESWFGRVVLHAVLYAIAGKPVEIREQGIGNRE